MESITAAGGGGKLATKKLKKSTSAPVVVKPAVKTEKKSSKTDMKTSATLGKKTDSIISSGGSDKKLVHAEVQSAKKISLKGASSKETTNDDVNRDVVKKTNKIASVKESLKVRPKESPVVATKAPSRKDSVKVPKELFRDISKDISNNSSRDMAKELSRNMAKDLSKEISIAQDSLAKDLSFNVTKDLSLEFSKDTSKNSLKNSSRESSVEFSKELYKDPTRKATIKDSDAKEGYTDTSGDASTLSGNSKPRAVGKSKSEEDRKNAEKWEESVRLWANKTSQKDKSVPSTPSGLSTKVLSFTPPTDKSLGGGDKPSGEKVPEALSISHEDRPSKPKKAKMSCNDSGISEYSRSGTDEVSNSGRVQDNIFEKIEDCDWGLSGKVVPLPTGLKSPKFGEVPFVGVAATSGIFDVKLEGPMNEVKNRTVEAVMSVRDVDVEIKEEADEKESLRPIMKQYSAISDSTQPSDDEDDEKIDVKVVQGDKSITSPELGSGIGGFPRASNPLLGFNSESSSVSKTSVEKIKEESSKPETIHEAVKAIMEPSVVHEDRTEQVVEECIVGVEVRVSFIFYR